MKIAKIIGLAVVAALALMTMFGTGTASAKLCSKGVAGSGCGGSVSHGEVYTGVIAASLESGQHATFTTGFVNVTCKNSTLAASVTNGGATPATANITSLTFSECTDNFGRPCTASTTAAPGNPWAAAARTGAAPNGFLEVSSVTIQFTCGETTCKYGPAKVGTKNEITVTGGTGATVKPTSAELTGEGSNTFPCDAKLLWHGAYTVTTPSTLYLT